MIYTGCLSLLSPFAHFCVGKGDGDEGPASGALEPVHPEQEGEVGEGDVDGDGDADDQDDDAKSGDDDGDVSLFSMIWQCCCFGEFCARCVFDEMHQGFRSVKALMGHAAMPRLCE